VIAPEVPTGGSVGQAIFDHHPHRQGKHAVRVMAPGGSEVGEIDVAILLARRARMRRVRHQEGNGATGGYIAEIVQGPLVGGGARGALATARAGRLLVVTMIQSPLRCWEVLDIDHPLGRVWHVFARSKHRWLLWKKREDRSSKREHLPCPYRTQESCYSLAYHPI